MESSAGFREGGGCGCRVDGLLTGSVDDFDDFDDDDDESVKSRAQDDNPL